MRALPAHKKAAISVYVIGEVIAPLIPKKSFRNCSVKILGASPEAFEFPDLKIEGTKQASGN